MSKNLFLFARICCVVTLMFACDDDDKKHDNDEGGTPAGAQGGTPAGSEGGTPAGAQGGTPAGAQGGTPAGAQGGTPAGAQGGTPAGNPDPNMVCQDACNALGDCAVSVCAGYEEADKQRVVDGCVTTCQGAPGLAALFNRQETCEDKVAFASNANPNFAAACMGTPAGMTGGTPAGMTGGTPAGSEGGTPAGSEGGTPAGSEGGTPAGAQGGTPAGSEGGTPAGAQGGTPAGSEGGTPAGAQGGTPAGSEGGTPAGAQGGTPAGSEGGTSGGTPAGMTGGTTGGTTGGMTGGMMGSDLPAPVNQSGTIAVGSEATYRFETTSEVVASVSTFGCDDPTSDAYDTDTKVYIYPVVDGVRGDTAIASNDDISYSGGNTCSAFIVQLPVGSYEIVVEDYSRNDEIQYNLSVVFYQAAVTGDVCNDQSICVDDNTDCFDGVCSSNIANVGEACNDRLFCVAGAGCLDNVCVDGSPTVLSVNAFSRLNGADTIVSFQFEASDPDLNVDSFSSIRLLDDQGVELYTRSFGFFGSQTTATFTDTYQFTVFGQNLSPKSIEVIIEDNDGNASDAFVADVQAYPTNLPVGASCLDNAYTGTCDTGLACSAGTCIVPAPECPMDYQTMSLTELRTGFWSYQGDNTNTPNRAVATCASSSNEDVIAWHAIPGTYTITATPVEPNDDLVLFARSYCGFADARFELGCQDEGGGGDLETITLTVDTEQTVYLFVGGWNSGNEGSYRLDVIDQAAQMTNLQIGDMCDAYATCATGLSCMVGTCVLPSAECPAAYDVKMLTESNGVWTYAGNTTTAANISSASCATSETEDVISATLTAGKYAVELNVIDQADMVLFARTVCSINDPQFELGCKDGAGRGNDEATTIELLADETVYFYVGAYGASDVGAYELTVRPIVENLASGDACDAYRICDTGLTCMNDVCVSSVPMVNSASAYFAGYENNLSTLFITINGMDNDMDSSLADIKVWDSSDNEIDSKLGVFVGFTSDATFSYTYSLTSDLDLTNAAKVSIELIDDMDQRSNTYIQDILPLPILNAGDICNPSSDALGRCDVGLYCIENVCDDPANYAACPAEWTVYDTTYNGTTNSWEYIGTTVDTSNDLMTCKSYATGYEDAIKFDAPAAGTYVIELLSDFDGILGVREYCNLNVSSFDLACTDVVSEFDTETKTITVDAAKSIYIFVDSYKFGSPTFGSYIVTITQQ